MIQIQIGITVITERARDVDEITSQFAFYSSFFRGFQFAKYTGSVQTENIVGVACNRNAVLDYFPSICNFLQCCRAALLYVTSGAGAFTFLCGFGSETGLFSQMCKNI